MISLARMTGVFWYIGHDQERHLCRWTLSDGQITVQTPWGDKTTQLGEQKPETLARLLAAELFRQPTC